MTTLKFADTHNMVAFLAKPAKSEGFEQIVDFLNAHTIKYALTINPTIYTSCIEQFWATVKMKTVNEEVQLQALVDGNKIIITKSIVRRDLQLEDAEGVDSEQDNGNIIKTRSKATPNEVGSQGITLGDGPRRQETMGDTIAQTRSENAQKLGKDVGTSFAFDLHAPRFFDEVEFVIDLDFIQRYSKRFINHELLQIRDVKCTMNSTQLL
ncbi:hypothetical protein Tco_0452260 [Tanacetum coccineum]